MNIQHFFVSRDTAAAAGFEMTTPLPHDDGFECSLIKNGVVVFTALRDTEDQAIQACLDDILVS